MTDKVITEADQLLIDSIKGIKSGVSQTIDFAKEQVPDVIQQLVTWNFVSAIACIVLGLFLFSFGIWSGYKIAKENEEGEYAPIILFISLPCVIFGGVIMFSNTLLALKLYLAPKVWLLEYAATSLHF